MSSHPTFIDACLAGDVFLWNVGDWVERWHATSGAPDGEQISLREYLGLTDDEYSMWVEAPTSLRFAVAAREAGRPVSEVKAVAALAHAAARTHNDDDARELVEWLRETGRITDDDLDPRAEAR